MHNEARMVHADSVCYFNTGLCFRVGKSMHTSRSVSSEHTAVSLYLSTIYCVIKAMLHGINTPVQAIV